MKTKTLLAAALAALVLAACNSGTPESVKTANELAKRLIPAQAKHIVFREIPADTTDVFELSSEGGKIVIGANNAGTMAVGLNYYLNNYCNTTVSEYAAHPVEMPEVLPEVSEPVRVSAKVQYRFYLNYCTFGYTMPWWGWKEWERFIDWMALNGVNMPLATTGEEATWQRVWRRFGMSDDQIREHFTGPAHLAWHRMVNINKFQGPLPQDWIDAQAELEKKILARERSLSMTPVLHSFSGSVPAVFKDMHPEANISKVSNWGGFGDPYRCWFLSPTDPIYKEVQKVYIEEQTALFGTDHIYGLDPFNEVDAPSWDPETLAAMGSAFYGSLEAADPDAIWLQMGWFLINDRKHWTSENMEAFLGSVPKGKMIMLDYHDDWTLGWKITDSFYGHPYIACALLNFGGNTLFNGNFPTLIPNYEETFRDGGRNLQGVGSTLEGFGTNPYYYEFVLSLGWNYPQSPDEWIDKLADRHIGREDAAARALWHRLIKEIAPQYTGTGVSMNAHPKFGEHYNWTVKYPDIKGWTPFLKGAWREMLEIGSDRYEYKYDVANIGRQALGDYFDILKDSLETAWNNKDLALAKALKAEMSEVLDDCDALMACIPEMNLQNWNEAARSWGKTPAEKDYYERCARTIVSIWGNNRGLTDYANRQWAGLIKSYYKPRWMMFCDDIIAGIEDGKLVSKSNYDARLRFHEVSWTEPSVTPIDYTAPGDPLQTARRIADRYGF
ncbi:MAG: alpha-N-acetylglucosaminidase [Bacteroidales bacterium]|nr:alpha-N-acetylglucosaminidase [Bacteroidales bacterium]